MISLRVTELECVFPNDRILLAFYEVHALALPPLRCRLFVDTELSEEYKSLAVKQAQESHKRGQDS